MSASSLVHELRQPLFALRGRLQLLQQAEAHPSDAAYAELLASLDHIEALLDHYGPTDEALPLAPFDVRESVDAVITMLRPRAEASGIVICADVPPDPVRVAGPAVALRQALVNLLHNAMDAVAPSPVREIVVRVTPHHDDVAITIEDSGVGVPAELRPRLFEPFVTSKPPGEGTGLGLFISQQRVRDLGGRVSIEPGPTGGTQARVDLPRVSVQTSTTGSSGT